MVEERRECFKIRAEEDDSINPACELAEWFVEPRTAISPYKDP
jgi:hypothetical protein